MSQQVKPFVKWAGGKRQLLPEIHKRYPDGLGTTITRYAEPFVGGGAVLFDVLSHYKMEEVYISDKNLALINAYFVIKYNVEDLIKLLSEIAMAYYFSIDKEVYYYKMRDRYNEIQVTSSFHKENDVAHAALFVFLNKTCFNGLYRVNKSGRFNSPAGKYEEPTICDTENLRAVSKSLQNVDIYFENYESSKWFVDKNTFVYFDPPYRPLNKTSNFTGYTSSEFTDEQQKELAEYAHELDKRGAKILLSNSDPHNVAPEDNFFEELYDGFRIERVEAGRAINSKGNKRGKISELLISNY